MKEELGITASLLVLYAKSLEISQVPYVPLQLCLVELPSGSKVLPRGMCTDHTTHMGGQFLRTLEPGL